MINAWWHSVIAPHVPSLCLFGCLCLFVGSVHFGSCVSLFSFFLFVVFAGVSAENRYTLFFWYKEAAISQPPEITLTTHSMHTPLASIFCVALIFLTNDATSRPTSRGSTWPSSPSRPAKYKTSHRSQRLVLRLTTQQCLERGSLAPF